ncbi:MAG: riboflavin synthase [Trichlorobacter sp.]|jgi:riboflavin synthase
MFTGLIECAGSLVSLRRGGESAVLEVAAPLPAAEVKTGDSIAVNGVCLTVISMAAGRFSFDVSPETVDRSSFSLLATGAPVNLERALRMGGRLDGHLVTGHVDCLARLDSSSRRGNATLLSFRLPSEYARLLVEKGSVAIDGISLTVNEVGTEHFSVAIIPHTLAKTTLAGLKVGDSVNIETDLIGKYVARLLAPHAGSSGLTMEKLLQNGFI